MFVEYEGSPWLKLERGRVLKSPLSSRGPSAFQEVLLRRRSTINWAKSSAVRLSRCRSHKPVLILHTITARNYQILDPQAHFYAIASVSRLFEYKKNFTIDLVNYTSCRGRDPGQIDCKHHRDLSGGPTPVRMDLRQVDLHRQVRLRSDPEVASNVINRYIRAKIGLPFCDQSSVRCSLLKNPADFGGSGRRKNFAGSKSCGPFISIAEHEPTQNGNGRSEPCKESNGITMSFGDLGFQNLNLDVRERRESFSR